MKFYLYSVVFLTLISCASDNIIDRRDNANKIAHQNNWSQSTLSTGETFDLVAFTPKSLTQSDILTIYIEGDGYAWINRSRISTNPTPHNPTGLKLAMTDKNAVYIARPCQYIDINSEPHCESKYWGTHRFAPEVILSTSMAIDILKSHYAASKIRLIGYSGGGAVAALVAARRKDVIQLNTFAGNLDIDAWTDHHNISPLKGSLNPADYWQNLVDIPQIHYFGGNDEIMPVSVARSYISKFPTEESKPKLVIIPSANHHNVAGKI